MHTVEIDPAAICLANVNLAEEFILRDCYFSKFNKIYNESILVDLPSAITFSQFEYAVKTLCQQYQVLNSNYQCCDYKFIRTINYKIPANYEKYAVPSETECTALLARLVCKKFNLTQDKLIRFYLLDVGERQCKIFIVFFHAILDGISIVNVLLPQLFHLIEDKTRLAPQLTKQQSMTDFYALDNKIRGIYRQDIADKLTYWGNFFAQAQHSHTDGMYCNRSNIGHQISFALDTTIKNRMYTVSNTLGISVFDVMLGIFFLLLYKITSQNFLVVRTNIDERGYLSQFRDTMGCFINNMFIGVAMADSSNLRQFLLDVSVNKSAAIVNLVSYNVLLENFRDDVIRLADVHFNLEPEDLPGRSYQYRQGVVHSGEVKNNLYFELDIKHDRILGRIEYRSSIFNYDFINEMISEYIRYAECVQNMLDTPVKDIIGYKYVTNPQFVRHADFNQVTPAENFEPIKNDYMAPRNDVERKLCQIGANILAVPVDTLGIMDDFFILGGNSILAMKLSDKITHELGITFSPQDICSYKTIKNIYDMVIKSQSME